MIVRTQKGARLLELAKEKGVLEFKEVPDVNLERLKKASLGKKRTGIGNIIQLTGDKENLSYLTPSAKLFAAILEVGN